MEGGSRCHGETRQRWTRRFNSSTSGAQEPARREHCAPHSSPSNHCIRSLIHTLPTRCGAPTSRASFAWATGSGGCSAARSLSAILMKRSYGSKLNKAGTDEGYRDTKCQRCPKQKDLRQSPETTRKKLWGARLKPTAFSPFMLQLTRIGAVTW